MGDCLPQIAQPHRAGTAYFVANIGGRIGPRLCGDGRIIEILAESFRPICERLVPQERQVHLQAAQLAFFEHR